MDSSDEEIFERYEEEILLRQRNIQRRDELYFMFQEKEFEKRFRLSKESCCMVLSKIERNICRQTNRNYPLSPMNQLLITLRYYATGTFQIVLGDIVGVHKSTISRVVREVTHELALLAQTYIKPPNSARERLEIQREFSAISEFPRVIGCIDCTHIPIISPGGNNAELYRNRKGFFSINVQAVCTSSLLFWNVVARWQGSTHDSTIFLMSRLRAQFVNGEMGNGILLGDGGYSCSNFLLTPLSNPRTEPEEIYNTTHIQTRNCIERAFGVVKRRFPCLSMGLRFKLRRQQSTTLECIMACFVLHNLLLEHGETEPPPPDEDLVRRFYPEAEREQALFRGRGRGNGGHVVRTALINTHFTEMAER